MSQTLHMNIHYYALFETIVRVSTVLTLSLRILLVYYSVGKPGLRKTRFEFPRKNCGINKFRYLNTANSSEHYSKYRGNFYPAIDSPQILSWFTNRLFVAFLFHRYGFLRIWKCCRCSSLGAGLGELGNIVMRLWHHLFQSQKSVRHTVRLILIASVKAALIWNDLSHKCYMT
jgi:hypothetical protein